MVSFTQWHSLLLIPSASALALSIMSGKSHIPQSTMGHVLCPGQVFTLTGLFLVLYQPISGSHFVMVQELVWGLCAFLVAV